MVSSTLRACLSRTSSVMRTSTAPGVGSSRSLQSRLANPDRSAVRPCLTMPTVFPSGMVTAASSRTALYQRKRMGKAMPERREAR